MLNLGLLKGKILANKNVVAVTVGVSTLCTTVVAHAADATGGTADSDVTSAFTTIAANSVATVKSVALVGVGIMTIFLLWKYGKKIFNKVAN